MVLFTFMSSWFLFLGVLCPHKYSQMQLFTFFLSFGSKYSSLMTRSWWLKWTLKYELAILNINWLFDRSILKSDRSINPTRQRTAATLPENAKLSKMFKILTYAKFSFSQNWYYFDGFLPKNSSSIPTKNLVKNSFLRFLKKYDYFMKWQFSGFLVKNHGKYLKFPLTFWDTVWYFLQNSFSAKY